MSMLLYFNHFSSNKFNYSIMRFTLFILLIFISVSAVAQSISGDDLVKKSIEYHDPKGKLRKKTVEMSFLETRPGGTNRHSQISFNIRKQKFSLSSSIEDVQIVKRIKKDVVSYMVDGKSEYDDTAIEKYNLNDNRVVMLRNYYQYLWLLPMKLKDDGTIVDPIVETKTFFGKESLQLKVTYDPAVGKDIWYFYFHPDTYALQGYRFYHDESANDGEYILLDGEVVVDGVRIPKSRTWYTHTEDKLLGADILESLVIK